MAQALIGAEEDFSLWTLLRPDKGGGQLQAVGGVQGVAVQQRGGETTQSVVGKNLAPALSQQRKPCQSAIAFRLRAVCGDQERGGGFAVLSARNG